jgi:DNA repair protein SbcC/Rad50
MLEVGQLQERLSSRFPDVEQVDDSGVRLIRKVHELPFAIYYFEVTNDLLATRDHLDEYLDRVIGPRYFRGVKSLQWNNYLYFVTTKEVLQTTEALQIKQQIEADRNYARKFVISDDELDSVLKSPEISAINEPVGEEILSLWVRHLADIAADEAILGDYLLPARIDLIESASVQPNRRRVAARPGAVSTTTPFIESLELKRFREYPTQRYFEFGTVNLLFGANGTGKTSLLEAIELYYCGKNKRHPDQTPRYEIHVVLADGRRETATKDRPLRSFRDKHHAWYGQWETRSSNLYKSFARFNFLYSISGTCGRWRDGLKSWT